MHLVFNYLVVSVKKRVRVQKTFSYNYYCYKGLQYTILTYQRLLHSIFSKNRDRSKESRSIQYCSKTNLRFQLFKRIKKVQTVEVRYILEEVKSKDNQYICRIASCKSSQNIEIERSKGYIKAFRQLLLQRYSQQVSTYREIGAKYNLNSKQQ